VSETLFLNWVNIWQSYKQGRHCLVHFARLANTLLKDEECLNVGVETHAGLSDDDVGAA